jgi:hypothetical protein
MWPEFEGRIMTITGEEPIVSMVVMVCAAPASPPDPSALSWLLDVAYDAKGIECYENFDFIEEVEDIIDTGEEFVGDVGIIDVVYIGVGIVAVVPGGGDVGIMLVIDGDELAMVLAPI